MTQRYRKEVQFPSFAASGSEPELQRVREVLGVDLENVGVWGYVRPANVRVAEVAVNLATYAVRRKEDEPVLAWATGLTVAAWNDYPGAMADILVASVGAAGVLGMLSGFADRRAVLQAVVAVADGNGRVQTFAAETPGQLARCESGADAAGWSRLFVPAGESRTLAGLTPHEQARHDPLAEALQALKTGFKPVRYYPREWLEFYNLDLHAHRRRLSEINDRHIRGEWYFIGWQHFLKAHPELGLESPYEITPAFLERHAPAFEAFYDEFRKRGLSRGW